MMSKRHDKDLCGMFANMLAENDRKQKQGHLKEMEIKYRRRNIRRVTRKAKKIHFMEIFEGGRESNTPGKFDCQVRFYGYFDFFGGKEQ